MNISQITEISTNIRTPPKLRKYLMLKLSGIVGNMLLLNLFRYWQHACC